jgi:hypothetical protein
MLRMITFGFATILATSVSFTALAGNASNDILVVHVEGSSLTRGSVVDGSRPLTLKSGAKVTFVGSDGKSFTMRGPITAKPSKAVRKDQSWSGSSQKVVEVLGALLSNERRSTKALGVVRSATSGSSKPLPNEWAVNVEQSGTKCIGSDVAVLWRSDATQQARIQIRRAGSARSAKATWPKGQEYLAINRKVFQNGQNYVINVNGRAVEMKFRVMPSGLDGTVEQAAWMAGSNCNAQALVMVDRIR